MIGRAYWDIIGGFVAICLPYVICGIWPLLVIQYFSPHGAGYAILGLGSILYLGALRRFRYPKRTQKNYDVIQGHIEDTGFENILVAIMLMTVIQASAVMSLAAVAGLSINWGGSLLVIPSAVTVVIAQIVAMLLPIVDAKIGNRDKRFSVSGLTTLFLFWLLSVLSVWEFEDRESMWEEAMDYSLLGSTRVE